MSEITQQQLRHLLCQAIKLNRAGVQCRSGGSPESVTGYWFQRRDFCIDTFKFIKRP